MYEKWVRSIEQEWNLEISWEDLGKMRSDGGLDWVFGCTRREEDEFRMYLVVELAELVGLDVGREEDR